MDVRKDNTLWISLKELWEQHPNLEVTIDADDFPCKVLRARECDPSKEIYHRKIGFREGEVCETERGWRLHLELSDLRKQISDIDELRF
ncbi:hypothetical protein [Succinimonas amylolytica]|uniref:hypothetical protein n=1 Tax=Succinimonas amylolytica TaxID=83769 RepID=UPI0003640B09|nr:hypothetical protein [Succinimonas amylolytica]